MMSHTEHSVPNVLGSSLTSRKLGQQLAAPVSLSYSVSTWKHPAQMNYDAEVKPQNMMGLMGVQGTAVSYRALQPGLLSTDMTVWFVRAIV